MFLGWETADQYEKKGSRAQGSHVVWETADQLKKGSWAQGEGKTLRKRGRKVQSPILGTTGNHVFLRGGNR